MDRFLKLISLFQNSINYYNIVEIDRFTRYQIHFDDRYHKSYKNVIM